MEALTLSRAKALAAEVVEEFGADYIYPEEQREFNSGVKMCKYVHDEKPSCLVGQILFRHGVTIAELKSNEFRGAWRVAQNLVEGITEDTLRFLEIIQGEQDEDRPWGEAVATGVSRVG